MTCSLSTDVLSNIAHYLQSPHEQAPSSDLAAFALVSRAFAGACDPFRLSSIRVIGLAQLSRLALVLGDRSRNVANNLKNLVVRIGPLGQGKQPELGGAHVSLDGPGGASPATRLLIRALKSARRLTKLQVEVDSSAHLDLDQVIPAVSSTSLRHLSLLSSIPLNPSVLAVLVSRQPHLVHLDLPSQTLPYRTESFIPSPSKPLKAAEIRVDGRRKRLRLTIPDPIQTLTRTPPSSPALEKTELSCLSFVRAPVSFILGLPATAPLRTVETSDDDIPRGVQRTFFEKLAQHGAVSGANISKLDVTISRNSMGLGVMQEITRKLRDLEEVTVRGEVKDAYFTYFLQDLAGCLSRCRHLRSVEFKSPARCARQAVRYIRVPNSDPSIPLPALETPSDAASAHTYPPNGPEVFRREQYVVNLYGTANPSLRAVTMPGGTTWRWCHDDICSPTQDFSLPPIFALPDISNAGKPKLPSIVVPSSPVEDRERHHSPQLSTAWGWEPDPSCTDARQWWEHCGLKPFFSSSPGRTAIEDDGSSTDDEDTDMDLDIEDSDEVGNFCVAQWPLDPVPVPSGTLQPAKIVVSSSPSPVLHRPLKRRASDAVL